MFVRKCYSLMLKLLLVIYQIQDVIYVDALMNIISSDIIHTVTSNNTNTNIPFYERQALYHLYNSTNGHGWIYRGGKNGHWDFTDLEVNPCLASNPWQGLNCTLLTLSSSSSSYYYISEIILCNYNLNGYLPDSIGNFSHLQYLDLSYNNINQTIPITIGNLSELVELDLSYNSLSGSLPNSIYELSALQVLNLDSNYHLQGTISDLIGQLLQLQYLNLKYNSFEGTIPTAIGNLSETLTYLRLSGNQFTGTIPNSIRELTYLIFLYLSGNQLTGKIPDWIGELFLLEYLGLSTNELSGSIPSSLSNLTYLNVLDLSVNKLIEIIPNWIGELSFLTLLSLSGNQLSGTIPSSLSNLTYLNILSLSYNQLTGIIPNWIGELSLLTYLDYSVNFLSGTIPSNLFDLSDLEEFYLSYNMLYGSIPNLFDNLSQLIYIEINNNCLTGTISDSISQLQYLSYLFVQNNHFSGSLDEIFNSSYQKQLSNIQFSNNQFTGKLPEQVFLSHSLSAFSAVSNCFHGSISSSICDNTNLVSLALDGLACASSCQIKIIRGISSAYVSENKITGGIPECLWSMANLQVLHLSGNSLTGSLPDNIKLSSTLKDLSLSYNVLTGNIPTSIQERAWDNLDLSHNRISGILRSNYASQYKNASLLLKNNRLSGSIPNNLQDMRNISILEGSYYDCKYDRSDLPTHDDHRDTYECGSNVFNVLYYIWIGSVFILCSGIILAWYHQNRIDKYIQLSTMTQNIYKWIYIIEYMENGNEKTNNQQLIREKYIYFKAYNSMNEIVSRYSLYSTIFIIIILLPVYIILSLYYSTHANEYAWTASILYLSGKIAFGIAFTILIVFVNSQMLIIYYSFKPSQYNQTLIDITEQQQNTKEFSNLTFKDKISSQSLWKTFGMYVIYITVNITIVGGANVAYVYVVLYQSNQIIVLCQILLSIFKMIWNNIISPKMVYWIIDYLSIQNNVNNRVVQQRIFMLQFVVSIINNIIIPCFIVAIISPNCFYHVFQQESDVTSSFSYVECVVTQNDNCVEYITSKDSTSYSPPFTYSYQCSSDFVTYYAPVFVLMGFISTFIFPLIQLSLLKISLRCPKLLKYIKLNKLLYLGTSEVKSPLLSSNHVFEFLVSILTMVGLLLTFGVVFPQLAVVFLLAIYRRIYYHKAIIGRYISYMMEHKVYSCLDIIEEDCKVIPLLSTLQQCGWILLSISCIFYTLFVFDILGDEVRVTKAYWVLMVMPCIPICIYTVYRLHQYWLDSVYKTDIKEDIVINNNSIELSMVETNPLFINSAIHNCDSTMVIDDMYVEDREGHSIYSQKDT